MNEKEKLDQELEVKKTSQESISDLADAAQSLAKSVEKLEEYIPTMWVDDSEPDIDAEKLNHIEAGIKSATDSINSAIKAINTSQSDIAKLNSDLRNQGIVYPESGSGILNPQYVEAGNCTFRKINGVCFLYFDLTLKDIPEYSTVLVSGIPQNTIGIYQKTIDYTDRKWLVFFPTNTELRCGVGSAGRYYAAILYPTN